MELKLEEEVMRAIQHGIRDGVKQQLSGYNSPLETFAKEILQKNAEPLRALYVDAITQAVNEPTFREEMAAALRQLLAKQLVQKFGGELEKQVNQLKSDPATRARITLAIEAIVKERPSAA